MASVAQQLQQALDRLRVPHPAVAAAAVAATFDALARSPSLPPAQRDAAIAQCLSCEHLPAVEAAVQALLQLGAASPPSKPERLDLLLTALAVAGGGTAPPLAAGVLSLFEQQLTAGPQKPAQQQATAPRSHPLSRALLSNAAAVQPLLLGVARLVARSAAADSSAAPPLDCLLPALRPFLGWALLDPGLAAAQPLLAPQLHAALARVAACAPSPPAQLRLLRLLAGYLPALRLPSGTGGAQAAAAAAAVADLMDALEACAEEPDAATVSQLAAHLVCLCHDAAGAGAPALLQQLLAALSQLAGYWPEALLPHAAHLGMLLVGPPGAPLGAAEAKAVLALLGQLLQPSAGADVLHADQQGQQSTQLSALLLLPLLQHVAFSGSRDAKQWAGHVLAQLQRHTDHATAASSTTASAAGDSTSQLHGAAAAAQATQQLLASLWSRPVEARHWLASLHLSLASLTGDSGSGTSRPARDQQQLDPGALLAVCALLQHPEERVQRAALAAAVEALAAAPLLGLSLLPLLVHQLQRQAESFLSGKRQRPPRLLLDLLRALPAAGRHPAALPFVLRTLQPLLGAGAPEVLQAAGLRLLCRLWHASGGRAYPQLRAAVIGYAPPGASPGLALRLARAECLRDIAGSDPDKAAELVGLLQECLTDESPRVQAIALDCIQLLCEADVLEFYAAWRVVHRALPRLPEHAGAAAAWVRLLGSGGLDAAVQPDAAAAIVDALWLAAGHDEPQVRCQAYASLAAFDLEVLEGFGSARPLAAHAALLRHEQQQQQHGTAAAASRRRRHAAAQAAAECEALVRIALAYEHATRRRTAAAGSKAAVATAATAGRERGSAAAEASGAASAMAHRLQATLPKQLLGGSAASVAELLQRLPQLSPAAVLYFYAPAPPPAGSSKAAAAAAARQAAADYQAVLCELLRQPPALPNAAEDAGAASDTLAAWAAFLRRWLAALRAAGKEQPAASLQQAAADTAMHAWQVLQEQLSSRPTPAAAANTLWAAVALCGCTPQPLAPLVAAVHGALRGVAAGGPDQSAAAQRAALAALGAVAEAARVTLGAPALVQLQGLLVQRLAEPQLAAAAATGLGLSCRALASSVMPAGGSAAAAASNLPAAAEQALRAGLGSLVGALSSAWPAAAADLAAAAAEAGLSAAAAGSAAQAEELLPSFAAALAVTLPAAAAALPALASMPRVLCQLARAHVQHSPPMAAAGVCSLGQAAAAAGFSSSTAGSDDIAATLHQLLALADSGSSHGAPPPDGRLVGGAAAAAGALLAGALQQGYTPGEDLAAPGILLRLQAVVESAPKLPQAAAAKCGAAAGLAALLTAAAVDPGSRQFKAAAAVLEGLAVKDGDPRARRACALPLAALCHTAKRSGLGAGGAAGSSSGDAGGSAASRGLAQLPADGVLRPLLESLLEGHWALPTDEEDGMPHPLSAADVAALLRCLAAAERLPAMNYGTLCRRLLRSHPGDRAVADAVATFAAAQGSRQQQQYHLSDLAGELLAPRSLAAAPPEGQRQLLRCLPQLLAALPEAQAAGLLGEVCQHVCAAVAVGSSEGAALLQALLQALQQLLKGGSGTSPALQQAAQGALVEQLLPALPPPSFYPLHLAVLADEAADAQLLSSQQRCWAAALRCLALLPDAAREQLAAQPLHAAYATAALVAAGQLGPRALQHPRNLLLAGGSTTLLPQQEALVALMVGRAAATLGVDEQQRALLEALDACKSCANPGGALVLAASIAACCAAAACGASRLCADHVLAAGPDAAARLPGTLPLLLDSPAWQRFGPVLLQRLAAALQHMASMQPAQAAWWRQVQTQCLLAARHSLPADQWPALTALL